MRHHLGGLAAPQGGGIDPVAGAVRGLVAARREDALDQRRLILAGVVEPDGAADVLERVARQRLLDDPFSFARLLFANASRSSSMPIRVVTSSLRPRPISSKTSFPSAASTRRLKLIGRNLTLAR